MAIHVRVAVAVAAAAIIAVVPARAQSVEPLPFSPGERLTYAGRVRAGVAGEGTLWVEGPVALRGTPTWILHSEMEGRLGPFHATDRTASWLDPVRMAALRYTARERHVVSRHDEAIDIFPGERRWSSDDGAEGATTSGAPLDELSFLYYVRTLPLRPDDSLVVARHFDATRNPTIVRVARREELEVPAGRFHAIVVEMRVRDARRYQGEGTIRIHLSDDACRLILRLESQVPGAGSPTLDLQAYEGTAASCAARR